MLSPTLECALNEQIAKEAYSAYLYLSISAYYESANLPGFAHWMRVQSQEEWEHALKLFDHVNDRGGRVTLQAIAQPPAEFASPRDAFEKVVEHEQQVTAAVNELYGLALKENDYATQVALQWFIQEQVEEEKTAGQILANLKGIGEHSSAIYVIDHHLAKRGG